MTTTGNTFPPDSLLHYEFRSTAQNRAKWHVPKSRVGSADVCPYCLTPTPSPTRDHIFPRFLGGRRWIYCCKPCNDKFGQTIEGHAEREMFTPNYVFLSTLGVRHVREGAVWRRAFARDGGRYDLIARDGSVEERLSAPIVTVSEDGRTKKFVFPNEKMAKPLVEHEARRCRPVQLVRDVPKERSMPSLICALDLGPVVVRPALKISIAAAAMLGVDPARLEAARATLRSEPDSPVPGCGVVSVDYVDMKELGKPLSHVVYVESTPERVYAIVQFFGVMQIWCNLSLVPGPSDRRAFFGTLDPVTGDERFQFIAPPFSLPINFGDLLPLKAYDRASLEQWIISGLEMQAVKRGGNGVKLRVSQGPAGAPRSEERPPPQ